MNKRLVAKELLSAAKELATIKVAASEDVEAAEELIVALEGTSLEGVPRFPEMEKYEKDVQRLLNKTPSLRGWTRLGIRSLLEDLDDFVNNEDTWYDYDVDVDEVLVLAADLRAVVGRDKIEDRRRHPDKYRDKDAEFVQRNRGYLAIIPRWLKPIMIEGELEIMEGYEGVYFSGPRGDLSPEFEEVIDLIGWADENLR